ncbi:MAG: polysaccharide biosynthesis tyrosine autokinase [Aquabacterium sp.]|nr:MAG: polysaccharide biosynthesis tyrosine autokinase [Aquabacterium sp.]
MRISQHSHPSSSSPNRGEDATQPGSVHDRSMGDLLRSVRNLSDVQVSRIVLYQREHELRFGEAAVALKLASEDDVLWALSQQFHYPYAPQDRGKHSPELVVASDPFSAQAEVFRDLCSQVAMSAEAEPQRGGHAVGVVSPDVGDGKTFLAANLAVAFSQVGGRTLLVDADMRTPRQHSVFGIDGSAGLSSALAGRTGTNAIQAVPDLPSLFVMPVGTVPPNPMELLQRPAFALLMQELLTKFDHVVVDTPAFTRGADARVIAARCGSAIAVGRKGRSRIAAMNGVIGALGTCRTKVVGVVMNER